MATRTYFYAESLTRSVSTLTTFTTKVTLSFTPNSGARYAIFWNCILDDPFAASTQLLSRLRNTTSNTVLGATNNVAESAARIPAGGLAFFTAVSSAQQTLVIEYAAITGGTQTTTGIQEARLLVLMLEPSDVTVESLAETSTVNTTYVTKALLSWTPPTAGDYLIIASAYVKTPATGSNAKVRLASGANTYSVADSLDWMARTDYTTYVAMARGVNLSVAQSWSIDFGLFSTGTSNTSIRDARILALRMSGFDASYWAEDRIVRSSVSATYADTAATVTATPVAQDHFVIASGLSSSTGTVPPSFVGNRINAGGAALGSVYPQSYVWTNGYNPWFSFGKRTEALTPTTWKTQFARVQGTDTVTTDENVIAAMQLVSSPTSTTKTASASVSALPTLQTSINRIITSPRAHFYAESLARTITTTTNYSAVKVSLAFTPIVSVRYLIVWSAIVDCSQATDFAKVRLWYGNASIALAEQVENLPTSATDRRSVGGIALLPGEQIITSQSLAIQFAASVATNTVGIQEASILVIELRANDVLIESLAETVSTDTAYVAKATLTWTPPSSGDYLVLASADVAGETADTLPNVRLTDGTNLISVQESVNNRNPATWAAYTAGYVEANASTQREWRLEFARASGAGEAFIRNARIVAVRVSDWPAFYSSADRTLRTSTSATYADSASVTATPNAALHAIIAVGMASSSDAAYATYTGNRAVAGATNVGAVFSQQSHPVGTWGSWITVRRLSQTAVSTTWKTQFNRVAGTGTARSDENMLAVIQLQSFVPHAVGMNVTWQAVAGLSTGGGVFLDAQQEFSIDEYQEPPFIVTGLSADEDIIYNGGTATVSSSDIISAGGAAEATTDIIGIQGADISQFLATEAGDRLVVGGLFSMMALRVNRFITALQAFIATMIRSRAMIRLGQIQSIASIGRSQARVLSAVRQIVGVVRKEFARLLAGTGGYATTAVRRIEARRLVQEALLAVVTAFSAQLPRMLSTTFAATARIIRSASRERIATLPVIGRVSRSMLLVRAVVLPIVGRLDRFLGYVASATVSVVATLATTIVTVLIQQALSAARSVVAVMTRVPVRAAKLFAFQPPVASINSIVARVRTLSGVVAIATATIGRIQGIVRAATKSIVATRLLGVSIAKAVAQLIVATVTTISSRGARELLASAAFVASTSRAITLAAQSTTIQIVTQVSRVVGKRIDQVLIPIAASLLVAFAISLLVATGALVGAISAVRRRAPFLITAVVVRGFIFKVTNIRPLVGSAFIGARPLQIVISKFANAISALLATLESSGQVAKLFAEITITATRAADLGKRVAAAVSFVGSAIRQTIIERLATAAISAVVSTAQAMQLLAATIVTMLSMWRGIDRPASEVDESRIVETNPDERQVKAGTGWR